MLDMTRESKLKADQIDVEGAVNQSLWQYKKEIRNPGESPAYNSCWLKDTRIIRNRRENEKFCRSVLLSKPNVLSVRLSVACRA